MGSYWFVVELSLWLCVDELVDLAQLVVEVLAGRVLCDVYAEPLGGCEDLGVEEDVSCCYLVSKRKLLQIPPNHILHGLYSSVSPISLKFIFLLFLEGQHLYQPCILIRMYP